jgi:hypothetical protein
MALILAIEPDRRQAARISTLGRGALDAEVLVADSTERGVAALHGRRPDLILTSLLLSPKDEAGLREFEKGGVPVPTLTIPVLAGSSRGAHEGSGLFARLQRKPTAPASDGGCDPKVFAAQIAEYLSHAHEEHATDDIDEAESQRESMIELPLQAAALVEEFIEPEPRVVEAEPRVETCDEPAAPIVARAQSVHVDWEEIVIEEHEDALHRVDADDDEAIELSSETVDLQAFVDELRATYADLFPVQQIQDVQPVQPVRAGIAPGEPIEPFAPIERIAHELPHCALWPSLEGIAAEDAPALGFDEVVAEFVAALGQSEPENPRGGDADSDLWMPLSAAPGLAWPRLESTCSRRPPQDEWGLYDPDQCGLSAVVAKLNEIAR